MDEADKAEVQEQQWRDLAIKSARTALVITNPVTHCLYCRAPLLTQWEGAIPPRWCDADCRDDWELINR